MTTSGSVHASRARAWSALVGLALPLFALSVDLNGVAVLLPDIATDLDVDTLRAGAIVTAAALGFAVPLLLVGRLADRWGPRRLLLGGVAAFVVSSVICAAAGSFEVLVLGRVLQGVASACCFTTSLAVIDTLFDDDRRPVAVGIWAAIGGVGGAAGPIVASAVASVWSWRAFFAVNLGVGAASLVVLAVVVPRVGGDPGRPLHGGRLAVLAVGLAVAMGALQHAGGTGWEPRDVVLVVAGAIVAGLAVVPRGRGPLVTPAVTGPWTFRAGTLVATTSNWGSGVVLTLVPPALAAARGVSVLGTGALFLAFSVAFAVGGALSGPVVHRLGGAGASGLASGVQAVGLVALGLAGLDAPVVVVALALAVSGFGNGVAYSAATTLALADVAPTDAGEASGLLTMCRLLGLTVAVAVSSMLVDAIASAQDLTDGTGLDVALLAAAAVTAVGVVVARGPAHRRR